MATFSGRVLDGGNGNQPLSGATVTVATSTGNRTAVTDGTGGFTLSVDPGTLPSAASTVVTITHDDYASHVQTYGAGLSGGASYGVTADGSAPPANSGAPSSSVALQPLASGAFAPAQGAVLTHLGDGVYPTTSENSRLQAAVSGRRLAIRLGSLDHLDLAGYAGLRLTLSLRGLEVSSCADELHFFQSLAPDGQTQRANAQVLPLVDSPSDGSLGVQTLSPVISGLDPALGSLWIEMVSGACGTGDQADDFEFVDVHASFF